MADVMFGFDLIDAGLLPAILIALTAGIISFLSPCVLPIVPPYLAYMSGVTLNDMSSVAAARRKAVIAALFFVMGLSTVFLILGFTASVFGAFFLQNQVLFARLSGIVVIIFGLHFLGVFRIPFLDQEARLDCLRLDTLHRAAAWRDPVARGVRSLGHARHAFAGGLCGGLGYSLFAGGDVHYPRHPRHEPDQALYEADRTRHGDLAGGRRSGAADGGVYDLLFLVAGNISCLGILGLGALLLPENLFKLRRNTG